MRTMVNLVCLLCSCSLIQSCSQFQGQASQIQEGSFAYDVAILEKNNAPIILERGDSKIVLLAEYQGRVMTSTSAGNSGRSYGWMNRDYLKSDGPADQNAVVGGEDRLWFGPETGPYSVFFKPGTVRTVENIVVPAAVSLEHFDLVSRNKHSAVFQKNISLVNHSGFTFNMEVQRNVSLFDKSRIEKELGLTLDSSIRFVGFGAQTTITNIGERDWHKNTGLLSIWDLGAFPPGHNNTVVIPVKNNLAEVTSYFTPTKPSHTKIINSLVYYRADADYLNKIGIPPVNTLPLMGSYDADSGVLTVVNFQFNNKDDDLYVNSSWLPQVESYAGDVINIFNDGKSGDEGPFGPFYELESSSNAEALKIGESQSHFHNTYHFEGHETGLNRIALALFGVSLDEIKAVFPNHGKR